MTYPYLSIGYIERRFSTGNTETLGFGQGVNVLVGPPNTGKTKWLETLDFLMGDSGGNPFEGAEETGLAEKYEVAAAELVIAEESVRVERRWREEGARTKIFVGDQPMSTSEFQHWLMEKLGIPLLRFPKGNPMSGQTWPELSFRSLLRHIYRRQPFWGDIADKQTDSELHASVLQFLGLAEHIFTEDYGQLIKFRMEVERLKARRDQYGQTLQELARDILSEPGLSVGVSTATVRAAEERLANEIEVLRGSRSAVLVDARDRTVPAEHRGRIAELGERRADTLFWLEELRNNEKAVAERLAEMKRYEADLNDELERISRAEDAGLVLADLKITHCPACDQPFSQVEAAEDHCFLCHQHLDEAPLMEELGSVRLRFEQERLNGELKEATSLVDVLERDGKRIEREMAATQEKLRMYENELAPARQAVAALVQDEISAIDMALGEANERQRQISRIAAAQKLGDRLTEDIKATEDKIVPLQERVDESARATDFDAATALLEDGINAYLNAINLLRPGVWRHNPVTVDASRSRLTIRIGNRRWNAVLGGTDSLYFLMAYHYGLLSLSDKAGCHYPGFSIIDVPGEFSGEAVEDKENFIVQPFIDLMSRDEYKGAQLIITGASFTGLQGVHRRELKDIFIA